MSTKIQNDQSPVGFRSWHQRVFCTSKGDAHVYYISHMYESIPRLRFAPQFNFGAKFQVCDKALKIAIYLGERKEE